VVPLDAILTLSGVSRVFVVEQGTVKSVTVRLGRQSGSRQVILEGLAAGQQVVTSGHSRLADGRSVEVRSVTNAPAATELRAP
jgi:membrane fusion protein (multidrug efflux system)